MKPLRTRLAIAVAAMVAIGVTAPAQVATANSTAGRSGVAQEYVVSFTVGAEAAAASISAAGGTVVEVNTSIGLAKVSSPNTGFLAAVRTQQGISGAARNHSIGTVQPGMPHRTAGDRPTDTEKIQGAQAGSRDRRDGKGTEPLAGRQWDMTLIGADVAHRKATGKGVDVGIIDTGIDATHPDLAANFDATRSRNFTTDIPAIDGPCEVASCVDPANTDDGGHGTHVAGIVAAASNRFGISGVAPDATLVNLRAGQDSGYFFLYETVSAIVAAGDLRLDVVNMSFYTDPWLFNCSSRADYISGDVSDEEIAQQALIRSELLKAVTYASDRGVTLVAAAGNGHANYAAPTRSDASSPDYPAGAARSRVVTNNCLDLPNEAPQVISVSSVGPSGTKSDFSDYGFGDVEVAAPGGWFRDGFGTPTFATPGNLVLSTYPLHVAISEGLADVNGNPVDDFSVKYCNTKHDDDAVGSNAAPAADSETKGEDNDASNKKVKKGTCGFYTYLQGTSMASPHAAGVAALIIDRFGNSTRGGGKALDPAKVRQILETSATDHACPVGGVQTYTAEGRPASFNAVCEGTTGSNGLYGEGIINAARAVGAA